MIRRVTYYSIAVVLTLLVAELFLRASDIVPPYLSSFEEDYGRARPNNTDFVLFNEGFCVQRFNDFGYLGPNYPKERTPGTLRITLLGNSFVEGIELFERHHFRTYLEADLSQKLNRPVEVLNFGRSGFHLNKVHPYFLRYAQQFNADYNLLFISNRDLAPLSEDPLVPYTYGLGDTIDITDDYPLAAVKRFEQTAPALHASRVLNLANQAYRKVRRHGVAALTLDKLFWGTPIKGNVERVYQAESISPEEVHFKILDDMLQRNTVLVNYETTGLHDSLQAYIMNRHYPVIDIQTVLQSPNTGRWPMSSDLGHWNHEDHQRIAHQLSIAIQVLELSDNRH